MATTCTFCVIFDVCWIVAVVVVAAAVAAAAAFVVHMCMYLLLLLLLLWLLVAFLFVFRVLLLKTACLSLRCARKQKRLVIYVAELQCGPQKNSQHDETETKIMANTNGNNNNRC